MADNKSKKDNLHGLLPKHLNTKSNVNWRGLIEALGESDQFTADLIEEVRKQFFIKTASRPYIDRLAANNRISRPRLVGMDDTSFRDYVPVLSYKPKQVKLIIDQLLDIFFFKESTTAFITTQSAAPFSLKSGWEFEYIVDELDAERIVFNSLDFSNISSATIDEVVASINRQAKNSYATSYYDSITKGFYIRLFTKTIGAKGSIRITGGRSNIAFKFNGFIQEAGNGEDTQWSITKIGETTTFQHIGGTSPAISKLNIGDVLISDIPNNEGSFKISDLSLSENKISFINLFSQPGSYTQSSSNELKFISSDKYVAFRNPKRAMTWETLSGEIVVEMPTSPPVVKRSLKGSLHINGTTGKVASTIDATTLMLENALGFPESGTFLLERIDGISSRYLTKSEDTEDFAAYSTRLDFKPVKYSYSSRSLKTITGNIVQGAYQILEVSDVSDLEPGQQIKCDAIPAWSTIVSIAGTTINMSAAATETIDTISISIMDNTLRGITPELPAISNLNERTITSLSRSSHIVTASTSLNHGYKVGETVIVDGSEGIYNIALTGDVVSGSNVISSLPTVMSLNVGQVVQGIGIPVGTTIESISSSSIVISSLATATTSGASLIFKHNLNGSHKITSITDNTFTYTLHGADGVDLSGGRSRLERIGMSPQGSKVILCAADEASNTRITGPYVWDSTVAFTLSSNKSKCNTQIRAGKIIRLIDIDAGNTISESGGYLIFDYGLNTQEGPVRYLYKPSETTIALDPSYVFQKNHTAGGAIVAISKKGAHKVGVKGAEYAPYVTNPSDARTILQDLIKSVKSAGIFINFLVRYPEQLYATLDVYESGIDPG